jgi:uncharacterized protein (TIGR02246 family)
MSAAARFVAVECAVRQLHARYADAVWRKDTAAFVDCFAEDAVWRIAGQELVGREVIGAGFDKFMAILDRTLMTFRTPLLTLGDEPGTASARTYVSELNKYKDGSAVATIGVYYERFAERDGVWRFAWRHWNMYYYGPPDHSAHFHDCKEFGPPPGMPGPDDPTTERAKVWDVPPAPGS